MRKKLEPTDKTSDTYDVAERAALCINALTGATNPLADHELYFWACFFRNPVAMRNNIDDWCQTKFMEALPLLRIASGSRARLEVDEVWHRVTLKSIGPDGLFYLPLTGRPWGRGGGCYPQGKPVACADGKLRGTKDPAVAQFSHPFLNARQFNALIVYSLRDRNSFWTDLMRKRVARMAELIAYRDDFCFWLDVGYEPGTPWKPGATGELPSGMDVNYVTGMLSYCAGKYHRLTGDQQAATLGEKTARFVIRHGGYFGSGGEFQVDAHFHAHTAILIHLLEFAAATGDRDTLEFVRKSYEWAKTPAAGGSDTIGAFPELAHPSYNVYESCEIADMIGLALKLSKAGVGDYYNDAERWIRNHFAESQLREEQVPLIYHLSGKQPPTPVAENETAWRVAERNVGAFAGWSRANDWAALKSNSIQHCCTGNAARTLYWIWLEALRFNDGDLRVNLLLNRASREADVYSFIPCQGKVEIKIKAACKAVYVHAPGWVKAGSPRMKAAVDGKAVRARWEDRYLALGPAQAGQRVTVELPIAERTVKETIGAVDYTLVIKGDTVVSIDPPGRNLPLYLRDHYRSNEPRYVEVERFLSDTVVEY